MSDEQEKEIERPAWVLPVIVICQFGGTSLWFAGNAVLQDLADDLSSVPESSLGYVTSSVQAGFILGTLLFSAAGIADRFRPTLVFMFSALAASALTGILIAVPSLVSLLILRTLTGVCLAGIYPVGMKVAADWYKEGLGVALGWLVGALVLGTAVPFLLQAVNPFSWRVLLGETAGLTAIAGLLLGLLVPDGPHRQARTGPTATFSVSFLYRLFVDYPRLRRAALGYFGHMWELYAFWAFVPVVWTDFFSIEQPTAAAAAIIASGFFGCVAGGLLTPRFGSDAVAVVALSISGICCLISPAAEFFPTWLALAFYVVWGMAVVADSPQFSSLVAGAAPADSKGSALTVVNCIGFTVTIGSIQLLSGLYNADLFSARYLFLFLAPGPVFGLLSMLGPSCRSKDHDDTSIVDKNQAKTDLSVCV